MRREAGGIGTAGASRTGRRNRGRSGRLGQPGQVGQVGGTGRAGGTGTGRAGWAGNTGTSRAGRNRPEQKKPGAENRSGLNRYRQAWLQQPFGQRPYAGCITEPQDASFLNRPHPCTPAARFGLQPGASPNHRTHPSSTGRLLAPAARLRLQPGASRTAEHHTVKLPHCQTAELPNRRTPPGPTPLTPCACSARARYRCAA